MAQPFSWFRPGFELVAANLEWNVEAPFIQNTKGNGEFLKSTRFSPKETPDHQWKLKMFEEDNTDLDISAYHYNSAGEHEDIVDTVLVKMSIINQKKQKVLQQMATSQPDSTYVQFILNKEDIIQAECQQEDGSYTFSFKILSHVKKEPVSSTNNPPGVAMNCTEQLATQLEGLFDSMQFSDVNFSVGGRDFPAHKNILATRSKVFAAIFEHPSKENSSNRVTIEDIEPEVFHEMLRFIYTGRMTLVKMESMAAGLLIAADKYLLDQLKMECENYLLRHMTTVNCAELLLHADLLFPTEPLKKESVRYFWRFPEEVMTTDKWIKVKHDNPALLCNIQEYVYRNK